MTPRDRLKVMIAGIGGASLGTELLKSLVLADRYEVYGCDISPTAYGLYDSGFAGTCLVNRDEYAASVISACLAVNARWLLPGAEQPMVLLSAAADRLKAAGIGFVCNHPDVIETFSDKSATFEHLRSLGIPIPRTIPVRVEGDLDRIGFPCIIKPSTGSGGSAMVFFATDVHEAMGYVSHIKRTDGVPLAQEYLDTAEGEFTVGVLSLPDASVVGSVALRRSLDAKLSVLWRSRGGVVSSGYSQGLIGDFPEVRAQAERIAKAIGSRGPLNIQGRVRNGVLMPFEINPRLSASTYLRALAGFNEADILLQKLAFGEDTRPEKLQEGWYLRSLTERFVPTVEMLA